MPGRSDQPYSRLVHEGGTGRWDGPLYPARNFRPPPPAIQLWVVHTLQYPGTLIHLHRRIARLGAFQGVPGSLRWIWQGTAGNVLLANFPPKAAYSLILQPRDFSSQPKTRIHHRVKNPVQLTCTLLVPVAKRQSSSLQVFPWPRHMSSLLYFFFLD
jgi:hypothetical protein